MSGIVATATTLYKPEVNDFALHQQQHSLAQLLLPRVAWQSQQKPAMVSSAELADIIGMTVTHAHLDLYKLSFALVTDLEEGFTRHVLDAWVSLMHELEELVHHSLQELPMVAQKAWILAHHIPAAKKAALSKVWTDCMHDHDLSITFVKKRKEKNTLRLSASVECEAQYYSVLPRNFFGQD